jgi:hypothetical protein
VVEVAEPSVEDVFMALMGAQEEYGTEDKGWTDEPTAPSER